MMRTVGAGLFLALAALMPAQQAAAQDPVGGAIVGGALGAIIGGAVGRGAGGAIAGAAKLAASKQGKTTLMMILMILWMPPVAEDYAVGGALTQGRRCPKS